MQLTRCPSPAKLPRDSTHFLTYIQRFSLCHLSIHEIPKSNQSLAVFKPLEQRFPVICTPPLSEHVLDAQSWVVNLNSTHFHFATEASETKCSSTSQCLQGRAETKQKAKVLKKDRNVKSFAPSNRKWALFNAFYTSFYCQVSLSNACRWPHGGGSTVSRIEGQMRMQELGPVSLLQGAAFKFGVSNVIFTAVV